MRDKWTIGIKVLGYFFIFFALLPYFSALILAISGRPDIMFKSIPSAFASHPWRNLITLLLPLIVGLGMLFRVELIRKLYIVILIISFIAGIALLFFPNYSVIAKFGILLYIAFLYFLLWFTSHPKVKEQFK